MQCGDYTYRAIDTGAEIMEYYGQGGEITLPETLDSLPVVSVGLCAFIMRTDLTAVTLPKTLRHIGGSAFEGCSALTLPAPFSAYARDLRVGLGLMTEGDTLIVGSYLGQAEKGSTYSVIEYIGSDTELIIPAFIEGCRVTKFNQRILEDMDSLRILSVPAGFVVEPTLVPEGAQVVVRPQV